MVRRPRRGGLAGRVVPRRRRLERRLVWIMGSARSGSTWLFNLLRIDPRVAGLDEPAIGVHLGVMMPDFLGLRPDLVRERELRLNDLRADEPDYFFADEFEDAWRPAVRRMILDRIDAQLGDVAGPGSRSLAVLKEPHGSQGADIVMRALPRSRLLFLLRDGRDVVDSALDAARQGSWGAMERRGYEPSDTDRLGFAKDRAHAWLCRTEATQRAYERHPPDRRLLVRYEDLRSDTEGELARVAEWLGLGLGAAEIAAAAERLSFESIPDEHKGPGQFARSATPGAWRQGLGLEERAAVEEILGPKLREVGYES